MIELAGDPNDGGDDEVSDVDSIEDLLQVEVPIREGDRVRMYCFESQWEAHVRFEGGVIHARAIPGTSRDREPAAARADARLVRRPPPGAYSRAKRDGATYASATAEAKREWEEAKKLLNQYAAVQGPEGDPVPEEGLRAWRMYCEALVRVRDALWVGLAAADLRAHPPQGARQDP